MKDVLWSENKLIIRVAKGGKDRRAPIPTSCAKPLRAQMELTRRVWASDRENFPHIGVGLPHQLAKKYPTTPHSWQWFWLFPAAGHCAHPRTGKIVRYHVLHGLLQRAVREAARKTGLDGLISPHVLRHA